MSKQRPTPDQLLARIKEEESLEQRGKLKIYLGAAPGVGKTYTMLRDAKALQAQGTDVVIGIIEAHGRKEIESLAQEFESVTRLTIDYKGRQLTEFNIDATLLRDPAVVLLDEMAHTNVQGSRHNKRWQDIKELLDRGIDVNTTLNVQHIESLNDVVARIISARIQETIPDSLLDMADTIELIDLPPEDLLKRLQEGKVYFAEQAQIAREHFFQKGNLIALRELALRVTAERVGAQVLWHRQGKGTERILPSKDKILVCVGLKPESAKVIRAARRMAASLQAAWIVVFVESPEIDSQARNIAIRNLRLAEQLGAETRILHATDIVKEIMTFAHEHNITRIMIGKSSHSGWKAICLRSLTNQFIRQSGEIDVYVVRGDPDNNKPAAEIRPKARKHLSAYGAAFAIIALVTLVVVMLRPYIMESSIIMFYLLGVIMVAWFGQMGPSIIASILSVALYDIFFIATPFSFDFITPLVMLLVAQLISHLTVINRLQAKSAKQSAQRITALHYLSRQLSATRGIDNLLAKAVQYIAELFNSEVMVLLPEGPDLKIRAVYKGDDFLSEKELSIAQWVYDLGQSAGLGTETLTSSKAMYIPLLASKGVVGVMRVLPIQTDSSPPDPEQMQLLEACTHQTAMAVESDRMQEQNKKLELQNEADRMRTIFLQSVSQDLHVPVITIMTDATELTNMTENIDIDRIRKISDNIYSESEHLNRLITNLLQIAYLEAHPVTLKIRYYTLSKALTNAIKILEKRLGITPVYVNIPANFPKIPFDRVFIQEVFKNLIDNAIKYTPDNKPIEISAVIEDDKAVISVSDQGKGLSPYEMDKLFDKFYRGHEYVNDRGMGLGLTICRSIIKAHGGEIWAEVRKGGGAVFRFTLPLISKPSAKLRSVEVPAQPS
jgi:two-component system sensor histidine kinase KdpD